MTTQDFINILLHLQEKYGVLEVKRPEARFEEVEGICGIGYVYEDAGEPWLESSNGRTFVCV